MGTDIVKCVYKSKQYAMKTYRGHEEGTPYFLYLAIVFRRVANYMTRSLLPSAPHGTHLVWGLSDTQSF